jgi:UDP-N-acetylmuramyl pentapeptide phosphotransferase/UDP-N-acetylglucosamine-1-phosphate transferase
MLIAALLTALLVSVCLQPLMIKVLESRQLLDQPNERSSHVAPTPRGGGIAVVLGVLVALAVVVVAPWPALAGVGLLALLGLIDDVVGLSALVRLGCQMVLGIGSGVLLTSGSGASAMGIALLIGVWIVFFVNAFNFMDGINGISALQTIATGLVFCLVGVVLAEPLVIGWALALVGAAVGFLPFNFGRAQVFLGDVGSYGLGAAVALLVVYAVQSGVPAWVAGAVLSIYAIDVTMTVLRRIRSRQRLLTAHRTHIYQQLTSAGWSHLAVSGIVASLSAIVGLCALLAWRLESVAVDIVAGSVATALMAAYATAPTLAKWNAARNDLGRPG